MCVCMCVCMWISCFFYQKWWIKLNILAYLSPAARVLRTRELKATTEGDHHPQLLPWGSLSPNLVQWNTNIALNYTKCGLITEMLGFISLYLLYLWPALLEIVWLLHLRQQQQQQQHLFICMFVFNTRKKLRGRYRRKLKCFRKRKIFTSIELLSCIFSTHSYKLNDLRTGEEHAAGSSLRSRAPFTFYCVVCTYTFTVCLTDFRQCRVQTCGECWWWSYCWWSLSASTTSLSSPCKFVIIRIQVR